MNQKIKISQLPAKGSNLAAQDLIEIAEFTGTGYVSKSITGQEIIDAAVGNVDWGDIGGTLSAQTDLQTALNGKENTITAGTISQYFRGDKTFQTLDKAAVGLGNVDNTSDLNKPISTATQSALNAKQDSLGFTPVPTSRTLTINGVTQDLSANRTFTISTGITIGSTAIASGSVGRILFEGAGNVVQESSSLFWDATNNRLGIGTSTPTQALDVVGIIKGTTSAVGSMLSLAGANNTSLNMSNDSSGRTFVEVIGNTAATSNAGAYFTANGYQEAWFNVISRQASANNKVWRFGNLGQNNYFAIQKLNDALDTILFTPLSIASSTGNIGINTTTDAGFRLDVNGTARVSSTGGQTLIVQSSLDSSFTSIAEFNASALSTSRTGFVAIGRNAATNNQASLGFFYAGNGSNANRLDFGFFGTASRMSIFAGGNIGINTTTDAGFRLDVNGTARVQGAITGTSTLSVVGDIYLNHPSGGGSTSFITDANACYIVQNSSRNVQIGYVSNYTFRLNNSTRTIGVSDNGASPTLDASAILTLGSTTRGFLPPRMTTTQKNAIASPAAGLMVYDTTLNVISYYNGSMWI